ncbi:MAG: cob(I)yrinic acid a,c-diamide adenosyltransferase [Patescibacteria group bacterium]
MNTQFFTGAGDGGESKIGGKTYGKDDAVFKVLGAMDSVNALLGFCRVESAPQAIPALREIGNTILKIQEIIFIAQAECAARAFGVSDNTRKILESHIAFLEETIHVIDKKMPTLTQFIIPGGSELSARFELARVEARRAERSIAGVRERLALSSEFLTFWNRLSSVLFALARYANHAKGILEEHPSY